jgi:hypothetical protein
VMVVVIVVGLWRQWCCDGCVDSGGVMVVMMVVG